MILPTRHCADVSSNNGVVDLPKYRKAGHTRLIVKATEGTNYLNPLHGPTVTSAHREGLSVSHYHFCRPEEAAGGAEVTHFWRHVSGLWMPGDCLHIDLEVALPDWSWEMLARYHNLFCGQLANISKHFSISYMSESYYEHMARLLHTPMERYWLAAYGAKQPTVLLQHHLWGWQFTNGVLGPLPHEASGVGQCDISLLNRRQVAADYLRLRRRRGVRVGKRG
jgi:GH25 family lysozyme M1 (1,4-beta-N-acetylmuramidase)